MPDCRSRSKADSQDLCFLAGTDRAPVSRPPRRARGAAWRRHRRAGETFSLATAGSTRSPSGSGAGLGVPTHAANGAPLYVLDKDARSNRVVVGPHESLRVTACRRPRGASATRGCARRPGQAALPLAAGSGTLRGRSRRWPAPLAGDRPGRAGRRRRARPAGVPDGRRPGGGVGDNLLALVPPTLRCR